MQLVKLSFIAIIVAVLVIGCGKTSEEVTSTEEIDSKAASDKSKAKVQIDLFVMSKCPYGVQAEESLVPVIERLGDVVALNLHFIGSKEEDGSFGSLHGEPEIKGDMAQLCAGDIAPDKQLDYVMCMNENWREIPENWDTCAKKVSIDKTKLETCMNGEQGKKLLGESFERAEKKGVAGSPTVYINDEEYRGGRMPGNYIDHICDNYGDKEQIAVCLKMPPPPEVNVIALTDKRCGEKCDPAPLIFSLRQVFRGLKAQILDWEEEEAKKLAGELGITMLPAVLFDKSIESDADGLAHMNEWLTTKGDYRLLKVKPEFDPEAEICDNGSDDTGNGLVDCKDPSCKGALTCREETPGTLEVFVMSQCPYGALALESMKPVLEAFGDEMTFSVHFIADRIGDEFDSMHGQGEVAEDIRQLCAAKHYPKNQKYLDYLWCRYADYRSDEWAKCTGDNGIDPAVIQKCTISSEGPDLLAEDIKIADSLDIGGSPTWMVNGRTQFHGIAAADIQKNFCEKNPKLKGCKAKLPGMEAIQGAPAAGSCGN